MTLLQQIREKIVAAVPEIKTRALKINLPEIQLEQKDTIRLSDVLVAMGKKRAGIYVSYCGEFMEAQIQNGYTNYIPVKEAGIFWNLRKDSLDDQSPETIQFIHSILCV